MKEKPHLSDEYIDVTFAKFKRLVKHMVEGNTKFSPLAFVAFTTEDQTTAGTAYADFSGVSIGESFAVRIAMRELGRKLREENHVPVQVFLAFTGKTIKLAKNTPDERRDYVLDEVRKIERGEDSDLFDDTEDSVMAMTMTNDGRKRFYVANYETPADGGVVFYDEKVGDHLNQFVGTTEVAYLIESVFDDELGSVFDNED